MFLPRDIICSARFVQEPGHPSALRLCRTRGARSRPAWIAVIQPRTFHRSIDDIVFTNIFFVGEIEFLRENNFQISLGPYGRPIGLLWMTRSQVDEHTVTTVH